MDLTWALVRMPPLKLFGVVVFPSEKKTVPGWSGFNAVVHSCVPVLTNIGYCPMIHGSPTEFWSRSSIMHCTFFLNVYTVLNTVGEPLISKKRTSVVAWVVLIPSVVSSYLSLLSPATCTNTQVEMFGGNTTLNISLLAMISFAMLVAIASCLHVTNCNPQSDMLGHIDFSMSSLVSTS